MRRISLQFFSTLSLICLILFWSNELLAYSAAWAPPPQTSHHTQGACGGCHGGTPIENFLTFDGPEEILLPDTEYLFRINVPNSNARNGYQLKVVHDGPKAGDFIDSNGNILQAITTNTRYVSDKIWAETDFNGVDNFREFRWRSGPDANALPSSITFTAILVDGSGVGTANSRAGEDQVSLRSPARDSDPEEDIEEDPEIDSIDEPENRFRSNRSSNFSGNFQGGCAQITSVKSLSAQALISWLSFLTISFFGLLLSIRISRKQA